MNETFATINLGNKNQKKPAYLLINHLKTEMLETVVGG